MCYVNPLNDQEINARVDKGREYRFVVVTGDLGIEDLSKWLNIETSKNYSKATLDKLHICPPVAIKNQWGKPDEARGFCEVNIADDGKVTSCVVWYNPRTFQVKEDQGLSASLPSVPMPNPRTDSRSMPANLTIWTVMQPPDHDPCQTCHLFSRAIDLRCHYGTCSQG